MGTTVTSGGQVLFSQQWLWQLPTKKFRECHTKCQVPSLLGSWSPEHHGNGSSGQLPAQPGSSCLCSGHIVLSFPCHLHLFNPGFLRTCEHVTLSVSQEDNSRQGKTDQVQMDPRDSELAAGMGCNRHGRRESRARQGLKDSSRPLCQWPEGTEG